MRKTTLALVAAVLLFPGCNTMVKRTYQDIYVDTPGVENVECFLETKRNKYHLLAPGPVQVDRSDLPMTATCQKAGYITTVKTFDSRVDMGASQLNLFNGVLPGTAYDIASRSVYSYPARVTMEMRPDPDRVTLEPRETHTLQEKRRPVAMEDLVPAKPAPKKTDDKKADQVFSKSLKK